MEKKEYLSEEEYQKTKKKLNIISAVLMWIGGLMFMSSVVLQFMELENPMLLGILGAPGIFMLMIGVFLKITNNMIEINAYLAQQQLPVAKEGMEKMGPSAGVVAKEVAKGVKEGLTEKEK